MSFIFYYYTSNINKVISLIVYLEGFLCWIFWIRRIDKINLLDTPFFCSTFLFFSNWFEPFAFLLLVMVFLGAYPLLLLWNNLLFERKNIAIFITKRMVLRYFLLVRWSMPLSFILKKTLISALCSRIYFLYVWNHQTDHTFYVSKCRLFYQRACEGNKLLIWCSWAVPRKQSSLLQLNFHMFSCMKFDISFIIYICSNQLFSFSWTRWNRHNMIFLWWLIIFVAF